MSELLTHQLNHGVEAIDSTRCHRMLKRRSCSDLSHIQVLKGFSTLTVQPANEQSRQPTGDTRVSGSAQFQPAGMISTR